MATKAFKSLVNIEKGRPECVELFMLVLVLVSDVFSPQIHDLLKHLLTDFTTEVVGLYESRPQASPKYWVKRY